MSVRFSRPTPPTRNRLLAALPPAEYERLLPRMEVIPVNSGDTIYQRHQPIENVYFPLSSMGSMIMIMDDETRVEVGVVGSEGMLGIPVFLGSAQTSLTALWQVSGEAVRMSAFDLRAEVKRGGRLVELLQRYTHALLIMLAQNTACNRLHSLYQRAARWILLTHDRVPGDELALTQEFLSEMLGVRRAGVNQVMRQFQDAGWIRYQRGLITILDRSGLETAACECYPLIKTEYERIFE